MPKKESATPPTEPVSTKEPVAKKIRKKRAPRKKKPVLSAMASALEGPSIRDGELYFGTTDLQKYELAQYKVGNTTQAIQLQHREAEDIKRKAEQHLNTIGKHIVQLQIQQKSQANGLKALQTAIGERYNIDVSVMTYDDETGRIYVGDSVVATPSTKE